MISVVFTLFDSGRGCLPRHPALAENFWQTTAGRLSVAELRVLLRKPEIMHIHEVQSAILEADGSLSVSHADEKPIVFDTGY